MGRFVAILECSHGTRRAGLACGNLPHVSWAELFAQAVGFLSGRVFLTTLVIVVVGAVIWAV